MALPIGISCYRYLPMNMICNASAHHNNANNSFHSHSKDAAFIRRTAELADKSAAFTSPHPNFGCVIATASGNVVGEGYLYAQGTKPAEVQAAEAAGEFRGATAYLNMETEDSHGDHSAVSALVEELQELWLGLGIL